MSEPFLGQIQIWAGNFAPRGWAFCNGALLPIASQNFGAKDHDRVREALFLGVYAAILVWMKFGQVVNFGLAVLFLFGFGLLEAFLRLRKSSFWRKP